MNEEPVGLDHSDLAAVLERSWNIRPTTITHVAKGFGGWHWAVDGADGARWFVTADALDRGGHQLETTPAAVLACRRAAHGTARALADAGLDFVLPVEPAAHDGELVQLVAGRFGLSVAAYVEGSSGDGGGGWDDESIRERVAVHLGRLHRTPPPAGVPRFEFAVPNRPELQLALGDAERPWQGGPFAEPARHALRAARARVAGQLRRYDLLAARVVRSGEPWVLTHGEPHAANVLATGDGRVLLVDWDTVALAPRERDLWMILPESGDGAWAAYAGALGNDRPPSGVGVELRRLWWALAEIAEYVRRFRAPHRGGADDVEAWTDLQKYLPICGGTS